MAFGDGEIGGVIVGKACPPPAAMGTSRFLANQHWEFQERWLRMVFVDAFIHGYKHGIENEENRKS